MISDLWHDLRYGVRSLRKHALLSTVVVATLTLGIGVSTGIFTYYNSELLRARVDKDFDSFVRVYAAYTKDPTRPGQPGGATLEDYLAFRDQAKSLRNLAAYASFDMSLGQDDTVDLRVLMVTANFFSLYDLERPLMGRLLLPEDCDKANPVVVLSERLWQNRFLSDPQIVGKVVHFNGQPVTVVGVTPVFAGMINNARAWFPYTLGSYLKRGDDLLRPGETAWLSVEGRLNPGFSHQDASEELKLLASQQDRLYPGRQTALTITDGSSIQEPGSRYILTWVLILIMGAVTFFVLIVCLNITTLLLSRAAARRHEIAVRLALGVGRMRLIRMLLTETFLQSTLAGLVSLYIAYYLPDLLRRWLIIEHGDLADTWSLAPDWRAFVYLTLVTLLAGMLAGLTPALQSMKVDLSQMLKGRHTMLNRASGKSRLHGLLIGAQVALSFFLLWAIGVSVRAYQKTVTFEPGFETRHVLFTSLWTRTRDDDQQSWGTFHRTFAERLEALPGVQSVAYSTREPFSAPRMINVQVPGQEMRLSALTTVSPNFFTTLDIPIVSGRALREDDPICIGSGCFVVVSQTLAREFWPNENPLGRTLRTIRGDTFEIVGVAKDVSTQRLGGRDDPIIYMKWDPNAYPANAFVRFSGDEAALTPAVTRILREISPDVSVKAETIRSMVEWYIEDLSRMVVLILLLGAIAIVLAVLGIYGVVSSAVTQRTKELGIRIALGAGKKDIYSTIIRENVWPIVAGLVIGLTVTLATVSAAAQVLRSQPFPLNVQDPVIYPIIALLLATVALAAMIIPARRATRLNPMEVLRCE